MSTQAVSCLPKVRTRDSWISKPRTQAIIWWVRNFGGQETDRALSFWWRETGPGTQFWETTITRNFDIFIFETTRKTNQNQTKPKPNNIVQAHANMKISILMIESLEVYNTLCT